MSLLNPGLHQTTMKSSSNRVSFQNAAFLHLLTRPFSLKRPAAVEVMLLTILCAVDMYTTIYWVKMGQAVEANPLLSWTFHIHPLVFVLVKGGTFLPTLVLAIFLARKHPRIVTGLLRFVLFAYVGIYLIGVFAKP